MILKEDLQEELGDKVEKIKLFLNPEYKVIQTNLAKANKAYLAGDYKNSNNYFSKVIQLTDESSSEYKLAKSRIMNV